MILWFIEMSQVLIVRRKHIQYHWVRASNRENLLWVFADWRMKVEDWFWVDTKTSRWLTRCFLLPNTWSQEENQNDFLLFYVFFFLYSSCFIHWWSKMLSSGFGYARAVRESPSPSGLLWSCVRMYIIIECCGKASPWGGETFPGKIRRWGKFILFLFTFTCRHGGVRSISRDHPSVNIQFYFIVSSSVFAFSPGSVEGFLKLTIERKIFFDNPTFLSLSRTTFCLVESLRWLMHVVNVGAWRQHDFILLPFLESWTFVESFIETGKAQLPV